VAALDFQHAVVTKYPHAVVAAEAEETPKQIVEARTSAMYLTSANSCTARSTVALWPTSTNRRSKQARKGRAQSQCRCRNQSIRRNDADLAHGFAEERERERERNW
jgi:cytochrome c-type biogenesis protein CcmH/NrfF